MTSGSIEVDSSMLAALEVGIRVIPPILIVLGWILAHSNLVTHSR